jgi:hypothetical protein
MDKLAEIKRKVSKSHRGIAHHNQVLCNIRHTCPKLHVAIDRLRQRQDASADLLVCKVYIDVSLSIMNVIAS